MSALLPLAAAPIEPDRLGLSEVGAILGIALLALAGLATLVGMVAYALLRTRSADAGDDRWPLARAVETLRGAVRRGARPGWVWLAGLVFPSLQLHGGLISNLLALAARPSTPRSTSGAVEVGLDSSDLFLGVVLPRAHLNPELASREELLTAVGWVGALLVLTLPLTLAVFRLNTGLASVAVPERWRRVTEGRRSPSLAAVWSHGKGLVKPAVGLWVAHVCLAVTALCALLGPLALLLLALRDDADPIPETLVGTLLVGVGAVLVIYLLVLQVMQQLALQSLARNRRGMASALVHAWRLLRHDPWASARACLGELALNLVHGLVGALTLGLGWLLLLPAVGVARAIYWAEVYPELGGLGADDGVPGLAKARSA